MESILCRFRQSASQKKQREPTWFQWDRRNKESSLAQICKLDEDEQETSDSTFGARSSLLESRVPAINGKHGSQLNQLGSGYAIANTGNTNIVQKL